jgi:hypothetical protein
MFESRWTVSPENRLIVMLGFLSEDLPIVVEIVDEQDKIEAFLPDLDKMIGEGLVTMEKVRIITCRHNNSK